MARVVAPLPPPTETKPAPPAEACSGCWRTDAREVFRLRCGHVLCGPCLAERARAAMKSPMQLLPLRCCKQPVPAAALAGVLLAPELAFYQHLTEQRVLAQRQAVRDAATAPLATPCDFCGLVVWLLGAPDADKLLACGHVYCDDCHAGLRRAAAAGAPVCCAEMASPATTTTTTAVASEIPTPLETKKAKRVPRKAPASAPATKPAKGKRKWLALDDAVELSGATNADSKSSTCVACAAELRSVKTAVRAPCGHVFCRACVKQRCGRAIVNEDEGSIGVPLRCCNQLIPVDHVATALGKKLVPKYEALVAKRADAVAAVPSPRPKRASQAESKRQRVETTGAPAVTATVPAPQDPCVACAGDATAETTLLRGPCGHVYCLTCLSTMARLSLEDRALVPIRCCGTEFPIEYVRRALPKAKAAQYERFLADKDWRASDLRSDREYARVVKKVRGKQCPACGVGVQKVLGCSTMYCPHGHTFCWTCAANPCVCHR